MTPPLPAMTQLARSPLTRFVLGLVCLSGLGLPHPAEAREIYLNRRCQVIATNPTGGFVDGFRVVYRRNLTVNGQTYWFSSAQYEDGARISCLSRANYQQGQPLPFPELQTVFVRSIQAETPANTTYRIVVAGGNGLRVPLVEYRLNLGNPARPTLTKLRSWRESR